MTTAATLLDAQDPDVLRIVALGGIGEIGRNMTVFEFQGRLLIIDCGVMFPESEHPGVDVILPDMRAIQDRVGDIEAIVLTHGHEDHIGAIPFLLRMRPDISVVGAEFTLALVNAKCAEKGLKPTFIEVAPNQRAEFGPFSCEFISVCHSIPDSMAIAIRTPAGTVLHSGDLKLDQLPIDGVTTDLARMAALGAEGVDLLLIDSTNADVPGFVGYERDISAVLDDQIRRSNGRVIMTSFASNIHRIQQAVDVSVANSRKVCFIGRSMVRNVAIAQELGHLTLPANAEVSISEAAAIPDNTLAIICTGSQGEPLSALARMSEGSHKQISITDGDLIVFASSLVPGNETAVYRVVNNLIHKGANVITQNDCAIHVSGHANAGELLFLYNLIKPRNVVPVHGEWRHLAANSRLAQSTGVPERNVLVVRNGVVFELCDGEIEIVGDIPVGMVYVDGSVVGDIDDTTISHRRILGDDGFILAIATVDVNLRRPVGKPVLTARGFSADPTVLENVAVDVEIAIKQALESADVTPEQLVRVMRKVIGAWVSKRYRRRPMIVPTVVEVDA